MTENEISKKIIGTAINLYKKFGTRIMRSILRLEFVLAFDLKEIGLDVKQYYPMPFIYKKIKLNVRYR